jgi:flagellar biosynthesis regulator FlbT
MNGLRVVQLKRLLRTDRIQVRKIAVAAHEKREDTIYVFFDHVAEESEKDREILKRLKAVAAKVAEDELYQKLSNTKQRELYLLDRYALSKRESVDVIELVKIGEIDKGESKEEVQKETGVRR